MDEDVVSPYSNGINFSSLIYVSGNNRRLVNFICHLPLFEDESLLERSQLVKWKPIYISNLTNILQLYQIFRLNGVKNPNKIAGPIGRA